VFVTGVIYKVPLLSSPKCLFIVRKVSDARVVLAVDPPNSSTNEDLKLPERSCIVKLANSITYDR
jgi:hypothetical protein